MPTKRRRPPHRKRDEKITYLVVVTGWEHHYGLRIADGSAWEPGPYHELATLTLRGEVVRPEGFKHPRGEVTLSSRAGMLHETGEPKCIGSLSARGDLLQAYVFIPAERLAELVAVAASGRIHIAAVGGTKLRYRSGTIHSVTLDTEFDPEEW